MLNLSPSELKLASRIEDQLLQKFDKECGKDDIWGVPTEKDLLNIFNKWVMFWYNERPISKYPHLVIDIKTYYCNMKLLRIYEFADRLGIMDKLPDINI
ncbi:MAG: hypothetical protein EBU66_19990 [Bacteroidetes bacterium]|nr:hypothetical protein [Bacteroidota bacterium]